MQHIHRLRKRRKIVETISRRRNEVDSGTDALGNRQNPVGEKRPLPKNIIRIQCAAIEHSPQRATQARRTAASGRSTSSTESSHGRERFARQVTSSGGEDPWPTAGTISEGRVRGLCGMSSSAGEPSWHLL
jgi:hypothetical protein